MQKNMENEMETGDFWGIFGVGFRVILKIMGPFGYSHSLDYGTYYLGVPEP